MFVSRKRLEKTVSGLQASKLHISVSKQHFGVFLNKTCVHRGLWLPHYYLAQQTKRDSWRRRLTQRTSDVQILTIIVCVWDSQICFVFVFFFLVLAYHSDTLPDQHHCHGRKKHGGERERRLWAILCCFTHALAMAQQICSIPGSLDEDMMQVLVLGIDETDGRDPAKHQPLNSNCKSPRRLPMTCSHHLPPLHRLRGLSIFHHTHSTGSGSSLTGCPSLDNALASFDDLLLESRVVCCEKMHNFFLLMSCHLNVTAEGRKRVGNGFPLRPVSLMLCQTWKVK